MVALTFLDSESCAFFATHLFSRISFTLLVPISNNAKAITCHHVRTETISSKLASGEMLFSVNV